MRLSCIDANLGSLTTDEQLFPASFVEGYVKPSRFSFSIELKPMSNDPRPRLGFRVCYSTLKAVITFLKMLTRGVRVLSPIFIATHKPAFGPYSERCRMRTDARWELMLDRRPVTIIYTDHNWINSSELLAKFPLDWLIYMRRIPKTSKATRFNWGLCLPILRHYRSLQTPHGEP